MVYRSKDTVRHGGKDGVAEVAGHIVWLYAPSGSSQRWTLVDVQLAFLFIFSLGCQPMGTAPPTFKVGLPTSANSILKLSLYRSAQKFVSWVNPNKLPMSINYHNAWEQEGQSTISSRPNPHPSLFTKSPLKSRGEMGLP